MTAARRLIALAVFATGVYAFHVFCFLPYRCNRVKNAYILPTEDAYNHMGTPEGSLTAQRNLGVLLQCMRPFCRDVSLEMITAANYRVLGRYDESIRLYREALQLDRRPELYANLASAEASAGDREAARKDLLQAGLFSPLALRSVEDGLLREEVMAQLIALRPENAQYIRELATLP